MGQDEPGVDPARRRGRLIAGGAVAVVIVLVVGLAIVGRGGDEVETVAASEPTTTTTSRPRPATSKPTTTTEATTTTTEAPPATDPPPAVAPTSTAAPRPRLEPAPTPTGRPAPAPEPAPAPAPQAVAGPIPYFPPGGIEPYRGLGAWLDVLDWSPSYTSGRNPVQLAAVDRMADLGVQTLYIQTSRYNRPEDIIDPELLSQYIDRAHARGMRVVAWYMPTHEDHGADVRRLIAAANLPVDGICVNIESRNQGDIALRNERVLDLSVQLRAATGKSMSAVVVPPVATHILNPNYWPNFPWRELSAYYDVWMPMAYWTNRTPESGWRDGYRYVTENTNLIRSLTGNPQAIVHPVGGIADLVTVDEVNGMARAMVDTGAIGGSLYDYVTSSDPLWPSLQAFRR